MVEPLSLTIEEALLAWIFEFEIAEPFTREGHSYRMVEPSMFPLPALTKDPVELEALRVAETIRPRFTTSPSVSNTEYVQIFPVGWFTKSPPTERWGYEIVYI